MLICLNLTYIHNSKVAVKIEENCLKQDKLSFSFSHVKVVKFFFFELDIWSRDLKPDFTLKGCSFGALKLTKNADPNKYSHSRYGIGFDSHSLF